jgi:Cu+-exporting ATPase
MTCAACQARVQRALTAQTGVHDASVNLMTKSAAVRYDPSTVTPSQLVEAVRATGYDAELPSRDENILAVDLSAEQADKAHARSLVTRSAVSIAAGVVAMVVSMLAMDAQAANVGLMTLTLIIMVWAGGEIYTRAWKAARHRSADMNTLVSIGTLAAFAYSATATLDPGLFLSHGIPAQVYYEAVIIIIGFVLAGRAMEARATTRASGALKKLITLLPPTAHVDEGGNLIEKPLELIRSGAIIVVRPGERIPVDGVVLDGEAAVDESMLSGEPIPIVKSRGASIVGGTINTTGSLRYRATSVGADSVLARIVTLMRDAQATRAPIQNFADRVSGIFVPTVLGLALLTLVGWLILGGSSAVPHALSAAVSVLIIACPCAMGLAVPTAVVVATGRGADLGLLIKGGEALQRASQVDTIVLDKTGTITEGKPSVTRIVTYGAATEDGLLRDAAALERLSEHPLAHAVMAAAQARDLELPPVDKFESRIGRGVTGVIGQRNVAIGNETLMLEIGVRRVETDADASAGASQLFVAVDSVLQGVIEVSDTLRGSSPAAVRKLKAMGLDVRLLTGDRRGAAMAIARDAGIDAESVSAEVLPADKLAEIARLQSQGRVVAMVGDGVNDAPALAQSDVGVSMPKGTDIAIEASDIALMRNDLAVVASAISLARKTMTTMKQNLFWAFIYNVVGIPIAAGALYPLTGLTLNPIIASAAMAFSSVSVVMNSLKLRTTRIT